MSKELIIATTVAIVVHLGLYNINLPGEGRSFSEIKGPAPLEVVIIHSVPPSRTAQIATNPVRSLARGGIISAIPPRSLPIPIKKILSGITGKELHRMDIKRKEKLRPLFQKVVKGVSPEVYPAREVPPHPTVSEEISSFSAKEGKVEKDTVIKEAPAQSRVPGAPEPTKAIEETGFFNPESKAKDHEVVGRVAPTGAVLKAVPKYRINPKPSYPRSARKRGIEGSTLLRVEVLANGRVGRIILLRSAGYPILDRSAIKTVKKWLFEPARDGDQPIAMWIRIPILFKVR